MYRPSFFTVPQYSTQHHYCEARREKLVQHIFHTLLVLPPRPAAPGRAIIAAEKKKSGHSGGIITAVQLTPTPLSVSLLLCVPVFEAPADSVCIHPYINHCPYSIGYMVHGKYWFFPLPHCWRTHGFCEAENAKKNFFFFSGDLVKGQKWQARRVLF